MLQSHQLVQTPTYLQDRCCCALICLLGKTGTIAVLCNVSVTTLLQCLHATQQSVSVVTTALSQKVVHVSGEGAYTILKVTILACRGMYRSWRASRTGKVDPRGQLPISLLSIAPVQHASFQKTCNASQRQLHAAGLGCC